MHQDNRESEKMNNNYIHVLPINDLKEHDKNKNCWCRPNVDGDVVVHNSMDGREKYETGERKPS